MTAAATARDMPWLAHALDGGESAPLATSLIAARRAPATGDPQPRISPATGREIFAASAGGAQDVDRAVAAARAAFDDGAWGRATGRERARVLHRAAALLSDDAQAFAELIVLETGKPIREARAEVNAAIESFDYFGGLARDVNGRTVRDLATDLLAFTLREPAGVAGLIVPWNFPLAILAQKLPPALAAGCAAVVKPSPLTPLTALAAAALLHEAGLEPAALSVVIGGGTAGAALVAHPGVDVVSFTGSTETARRIAATAGEHRLKRLALEAGGKTPVIVTSNADLDGTIDGVLFSAFFNQGEVCVAGSRVLADRAIAAELSERLAERANDLRLGNPYAHETELGPLISHAHHGGVLQAIEAATAAGARTVTGGAPADVPETSAGPFLRPTVLADVADENPAAREEIFGPVTVVQDFGDLDEAVARANRSRFGLAASVWTQDLEEALRLTLALRAGTVWVNGSTDAFPELPLGGRRDSGFGAELGREGLELFTDVKTVQLRRSARAQWYSR